MLTILDVTMFDANAMTETVKIPNDDPDVSCTSSASSNVNNVWWPPLQQQPPPALPPVAGEAAAAAPMEVVEAVPLEANEHQNEAVLDQAINNDEQAGNDEQQPAAEEGQQLAVIPAAEQHQHPPLPELVNVDPQQQQVQPANTHPPTSEYQLFVNRCVHIQARVSVERLLLTLSLNDFQKRTNLRNAIGFRSAPRSKYQSVHLLPTAALHHRPRSR